MEKIKTTQEIPPEHKKNVIFFTGGHSQEEFAQRYFIDSIIGDLKPNWT